MGDEEEEEEDVIFDDNRFWKRIVVGIVFLVLFTGSIVLVLAVGYHVGLNMKREMRLPPDENPNCPIKRPPRTKQEILAGGNLAGEILIDTWLTDGDLTTCLSREMSWGHRFFTKQTHLDLVYYMVRLYLDPKSKYHNLTVRVNNGVEERVGTVFNNRYWANTLSVTEYPGNLDPNKGAYDFFFHNYTVGSKGIRIEMVTDPDNCPDKSCTGRVSLCEIEVYGQVFNVNNLD